MNINNKITIVIVLYNSTELIFDCFKSLTKFNIIIVDNGKNYNLLNVLERHTNIKIISKNKNLGFGNAINFAFESVKTEFFFILNPDVLIEEAAILKLLDTALNYENCAIVAPLNSPDLDSYGVLPEKRNLFEKNKDFSLNIHSLKYKPEGEICVDVAKGCALLINSKYFKEADFFAKKYFLFWEEIDLCRKFQKKKLSIIVNPSSVAYHNQGKSSKLTLYNYFLRSYHSELSPLYYFDVKINSPHIYKNMLKYFFRIFSYLCVLNIKNSLKNLSKLSANISYLVK
jgi:N-acetylglucosaminyl-diphospho-decaprenol L-rhamnosyltransferase